MNLETKEKVGPALGRLASGVYIVTTEKGEQKDGMLATWISQISFAPPMISLAVKSERSIADALKPGDKFVVNVLLKSNGDIFKNFAKPHQDGIDRFENLEIDHCLAGGPRLKGCASSLSCEVSQVLEPGDHLLILATVIDGTLQDKEVDVMTHVRNNGFQY